ncbi:MAG TPA: MlaD family protein [Solirubrobacterales bacterium]|nr:MlaD family protein [Solirubrobacterales bacterium]
MAANPLGEERSPASGRRIAPARIAAIAALALVVLALAYIVFGGNGSHKYALLFQNASQLVKGNQVLIGGQAVGTVDSIELTDENLAQVNVTVEQQLHEGTTAIVRATSLSGVANHYVSVSPGPNSNPPLEDGGTLGLADTTTPIDIDQLFNTFPAPVRRGLSDFIKGNAGIYVDRGPEASQTFKYFAPGLNRARAFFGELNSDQRLFERFVVSSSKLATAIASRGEELSSAIANANAAFGAIASQNAAFSRTLHLLPPVFRQTNTTFVNLRAALDDLDTFVDAAKPATKDLAPFLADLRPVLSKAVPVFKNLRLTMRRPGPHNDTGELFAILPTVQDRTSTAFPHAEQAIADFQPTLDLFRAYTPDIFNGFAKLGQVAAYYDANGHYIRVQPSDLNLFSYNSGTGVLDPIPTSQQYDAFNPPQTFRRCPGGATQPAPDGSNPFVDPPIAGGAPSSTCDPADVPPGP